MVQGSVWKSFHVSKNIALKTPMHPTYVCSRDATPLQRRRKGTCMGTVKNSYTISTQKLICRRQIKMIRHLSLRTSTFINPMRNESVVLNIIIHKRRCWKTCASKFCSKACGAVRSDNIIEWRRKDKSLWEASSFGHIFTRNSQYWNSYGSNVTLSDRRFRHTRFHFAESSLDRFGAWEWRHSFKMGDIRNHITCRLLENTGATPRRASES